MRSSLLFCLAFLGAFFSEESFSNAQITRDVGQIAVIEGDNSILVTFTDTMGNPCPQVTVDMKEMGKKFYQTHDDVYQVLIMFTNFQHLLSPDQDCMEQAGAFFRSVSNAIQGIGISNFNQSAAYGSGGALEGVINMNIVTGWPADPSQRIPGNNDSVMSLMAQEIGHRWSAFVQFDADSGPGVSPSNALLGRALAHWSFFSNAPSVTSNPTDMEASSLEGNFWLVDQPAAGEFLTATTTDGFGPLDLYLMGLLPANQVGQFWFIASPFNVSPAANASSTPQAGTQAQGTQTFVSVNDVIAVEGARSPSFANSPKIFRHAVILLTQQGIDVTQAQLDRVETYRDAWGSYFTQETQNRSAMITILDDVVFVDSANSCVSPPMDCPDGTLNDPFPTVEMGRDNVPTGGTVVITAANYPENVTLNRAMMLRAVLGTVTIGQ